MISKIKEPYQGICCEPCWNAQQKRCTCKCGGTYHGLGLPSNVMNQKRLPEYLAAKVREQITDWKCHWCGTDLSKFPILMYPHKAGWNVEGEKESQWLFIRCGCKYEWALWKLGFTRDKVVE